MFHTKLGRSVKNFLLYHIYLNYFKIIKLKLTSDEVLNQCIIAVYHEGSSVFSKALFELKKLPQNKLLFKDQNFCILISDHQDGDLMEKVANYYGLNSFRLIRKNIPISLKNYTAYLKKSGDYPVIAVDGPVGPYRQIAPGILFLQKQLDYPIRMLYFASPVKCFRLKTWDQHIIPFPGSRINLKYTKEFVNKEHQTKQLEKFEEFLEDYDLTKF